MLTAEIDTWHQQGDRRRIAKCILNNIAHISKEKRRGYVISMRATGWGDCLLSMISAWYLAKITHKTLIIDWRNSVYHVDPGQNAFSQYFQDVTSIVDVPVICDNSLRSIKDIGPVYSKIWAKISETDLKSGYPWAVFLDELTSNRYSGDYGQSTIVFDACLPWAIDYKMLTQTVLQNIKLRTSINNKLEEFYREKFKSKMIGIHVRFGNGGDIGNHAPLWRDEHAALKKICIAVNLAREKLGQDCGLFLSTDTEKFEDKLRKVFPNIIFRNKKFREDNCGELHHMKFDAREKGDQTLKMGEDALIDMYLLAKCNILVRFPPGSYFSFVASAFKQYQLVFTEDNLMPVIEY